MFHKYLIPSIFEIIITQPFDVWKIKTQAKQPFHIKHSFKGLIPRAIGFLPMRTTFWFLYDYTNKHKLSLPLSSFIITTGQTAIDYPVEIYKQRNILSKYTSPKYPIVFCHHYTRNLLFTSTLLSAHLLQRKYNQYSNSKHYQSYNPLMFGKQGHFYLNYTDLFHLLAYHNELLSHLLDYLLVHSSTRTIRLIIRKKRTRTIWFGSNQHIFDT